LSTHDRLANQLKSILTKICAFLPLYNNTRCCCAATVGCKLRQQMQRNYDHDVSSPNPKL